MAFVSYLKDQRTQLFQVLLNKGDIPHNELAQLTCLDFFNWLDKWKDIVTLGLEDRLKNSIVLDRKNKTVTIFGQTISIHTNVQTVNFKDIAPNSVNPCYMKDTITIRFTTSDKLSFTPHRSIPIRKSLRDDSPLILNHVVELETDQEQLELFYKEAVEVLLYTATVSVGKTKINNFDNSSFIPSDCQVQLSSSKIMLAGMFSLALPFIYSDSGYVPIIQDKCGNEEAHLYSESLGSLVIVRPIPFVTENDDKTIIISGVRMIVTVATVDRDFIETNYHDNKVFETEGLNSITRKVTYPGLEIEYPKSHYFFDSYDSGKFIETAIALSDLLKRDFIDWFTYSIFSNKKS